MFYHNINPILLELGPFQVRWYGLMYLLSFVIAYIMIKKYSDLSKEQVTDLLFYQAVFMIVFARAFEVVYYQPSYFFSNPSQILAVWKGGLSFHGGLFGFAVGTTIFAKKEKKSILKLADLIAVPAALGLMLGRIGNFINGELVGRVTNVPWCVNFSNYQG